MTQPGASSNKIDSVETAISTVQNVRLSEHEREEAIEYLRRNPSPEAIQVLITTLEDDDYGVRWAAGAALAQLADAAWPPLLQALAKPDNSIRLPLTFTSLNLHRLITFSQYLRHDEPAALYVGSFSSVYFVSPLGRKFVGRPPDYNRIFAGTGVACGPVCQLVLGGIDANT